MADLLRSGHKMLNIACPICNNPVFQRRNGETFCPTCNREVLIVDSKTHQKNAEIKQNINMNGFTDKPAVQADNNKFLSLREVIIEKINFFSIKLKHETQLDIIERYTKLLLSFYEILNKFSNLDI